GSGGYGQPVTAVRFSIGLSSQSHPGRTVSRAEGPLITERNMGRSMELLLLPAPIFEHTSRRIIRICPHSASHQSMLLEAICLPRATFMISCLVTFSLTEGSLVKGQVFILVGSCKVTQLLDILIHNSRDTILHIQVHKLNLYVVDLK
ncbi:hypothetical protein HID58_024953, partial [Brassica napus]